MEYFRTRPDLKNRDNNRYHVVHGLDADLILLAALTIPNALLFREDAQEDIILNIEAFKYAIRNMMGRSRSAIDDFTVMMSFVGNDFLPGVLSTTDMASALHTMMRVYRETRLELTRFVKHVPQLHWKNLHIYLTNLATVEPQMFEGLSYKRHYYPLKIVERNSDISKPTAHKIDYENIKLEWYNQILAPPSEDDDAFLKKLVKDNTLFIMNEYNFNDMLIQYVTGVAWCLQYYTQGPTKSNMSYFYPYFHGPLFDELGQITADMDQSYLDDLADSFKFSIPHQLLSVLPRKSAALIPKDLRHFATDEWSEIRDLFPDNFVIDYEASKHGNALVPFVDPQRIIDAVNQVEWNAAQKKYYFEPGKDNVWQRVNLPQRQTDLRPFHVPHPNARPGPRAGQGGSPERVWNNVYKKK
jgi:5'-3' exonuclease